MPAQVPESIRNSWPESPEIPKIHAESLAAPRAAIRPSHCYSSTKPYFAVSSWGYTGYDLDETSYSDAETVTGDTIMEHVEMPYDDASNLVQTTTRQRYHNAPASQTGELKNPSETPKARVTYNADWPAALGGDWRR